MDRSIASPGYTFEVDHPTWGAFVFRDLSIAQTIQVRRVAREIWGGAIPPDEQSTESNLAFILAELEVACVSAPPAMPGFRALRLEDSSALTQLWEAYTANLSTFRQGVGARPHRPNSAAGA